MSHYRASPGRRLLRVPGSGNTMEALPMNNCPLCSADAQTGAVECSSCGVIFAKLTARAERAKSMATQTLEPSRSPAINAWHVRIVAVSVVASWMLGLGLYYRIELGRRPRHVNSVALEGRSSVNVRDSYGLTSEVPVHSARPGQTRREEPPPPLEPTDSKPDPFDE